MTTALAVVVLLAGGTTARAAPEETAVEALLAAEPGAQPSDDALVRLATNPAYDPWLLVEYLLASGREDVAVRLAGHADEAVVGPLESYAQAPGAEEGAARRAEGLRAARAARADGDEKAALARIQEVRAVPGRVSAFGVVAADLEGDVHEASHETSEAIEAWLGGGEEALRIGWWRKAEDLFSRTLGAASLTFGLDHMARAAEGFRALREVQGDGRGLADALHDVGSIAQWRGDLPGALRLLEEALNHYEALALTAEAVEVRSQRSAILAEVGDLRGALDDQRELARYFEKRPRDGAWASNQVYLGLLLVHLGDEKGAVEAFDRALTTYRALGDVAGQGFAQGNLGLAYVLGGHWQEAIEAYQAAGDVAKELEDATGIATADNDVADALRRQAESEVGEALRTHDAGERATLRSRAREALRQAQGLIDEALEIARAAGAEGLACGALHTRGEILVAEGKPDEAVRVIEPARAEARRLRAWALQVSMTATLAHAHLLRQDWTSALREARAAAHDLATAFGSLGNAELARARSMAADVYDVGITAALHARSEEDLLHFLEAGRAAALLRGLGGRAAALEATVPPALQQRLATTTHAKLEAFTAWQEDQRKGLLRARDHWKRYQELRREQQSILEEIEDAKTESATRLAPSRLASIADVQRRLKATARPGLRQAFVLFNFQAEEATAFVVEERDTRLVRYPATAVASLREALSALSGAREGDLDEDALATVKRELLVPLGLPSGPTRLYVSPDRDLGYVPLSVVVPDDWEVVWEPSATVFDLLSERRLRRGRGVLGLGDPDYGTVADPDALTTRGGPRLLPLPATRLEVEEITRGPEDRRLLGEAATERGLTRALVGPGADPVWQSVHLACHGFVDVELPALSCLAITPGDGEDGFLSAGEVLQLPLRSDLAVLSACQTGRGRFVRGEGVMSLTRSFMYAGAPRVIVSLWDVDDEATAFLMQAFYAEWRAGRGTADALRRAQIAVRDHEVEERVEEEGQPPTVRRIRPWAHPRYWGAWVLWGLPD